MALEGLPLEDSIYTQDELNRLAAANAVSSSRSSGRKSSGGSSKTSKTSQKNYNALDKELGTINTVSNTLGAFSGSAAANAFNGNERMKEKVSDAYNSGLITPNQVREIASKYKLF